MEKSTKIIIGVGAGILVLAGVFLYFKSKAATSSGGTPNYVPNGAPPQDQAPPAPAASHITDLHQLPSFGVVSKVPMMTEPTLAHGSEGLTAG